jgi:hypothetical protein
VRAWWGEGGVWGKGAEMTQTLYAHMNKIKKLKKRHMTQTLCAHMNKKKRHKFFLFALTGLGHDSPILCFLS